MTDKDLLLQFDEALDTLLNPVERQIQEAKQHIAELHAENGRRMDRLDRTLREQSSAIAAFSDDLSDRLVPAVESLEARTLAVSRELAGLSNAQAELTASIVLTAEEQLQAGSAARTEASKNDSALAARTEKLDSLLRQSLEARQRDQRRLQMALGFYAALIVALLVALLVTR